MKIKHPALVVFSICFILIGLAISGVKIYKDRQARDPKNWHYPRFVHNRCTNMWAIQTGFGMPQDVYVRPHFFGATQEQMLYFGYTPSPRVFFRSLYDPSTMWERLTDIPSESLPLGFEEQFTDSAGAVHIWTRYRQRQDSISKASEMSALQARQEEKRDDSLYKCQHTYESQ